LRGAPRLRPPLIALSALTALVALAACLASPGALVGPLLTLLGGAIAATLAALLLSIRRPALAADLPPLAALALAGAGLFASLGAPSAGALTPGELALRCLAPALVCATLAAICPYPGLALGLMAAVVAGPALVVLIAALAALTPRLSGGAQGLVIALLVAGYLAVVAGWGVLLRRTRLLERVHAAVARRAAPFAPPPRLEGWFDPPEQRRRALALAASARPESRQKALAEMRAILRERGTLTTQARRELERAARSAPEALLVLLEDDLGRRDIRSAATRMAQLERAPLADPALAWLAPEIHTALAAVDDPALDDACEQLHDTLFVAEYAAAEDQAAAQVRAYNAITNRARPLAALARDTLARLAAERPQAALLLAEDDLLRDAPADSLVRLASQLRAGDPQLAADARVLWERHRERATAAVQQAIWHLHADHRGDDAPLTALALLALEPGLALEARAALASAAHPAQDAAFILAHDDLRLERAGAAVHVVARPTVLPIWGLHEHLLPQLSAAARQVNAPRFGHADPRPQLLEVIDAPPTALSAGRTTVWSWTEGESLARLAVLGGGPPQVRATMAAMVAGLAAVRRAPGDVVLADAAFFDLSVPPVPFAPPDDEPIACRILSAAHELGVEAAIRAELAERSVRREALEIVRHGYIAQPKETLAALRAYAAASGVVEHCEADERTYRAALASVSRNTAASAGDPFPLLAPYRRDGRPLRVQLPKHWLGLESYQPLARSVAQAALAAARRERERPTLVDQMARIEAGRLLLLRAELTSGGTALEQRITTSELTISLTGGEPELRASEKSGLRLLDELPRQVVRLLAKHVANQLVLDAFVLPDHSPPPRWVETMVLDAFLRGQTLPFANAQIDEAFARWCNTWRGAALAALDAALRANGLSLDAVAVENTVLIVTDPGERSDVLDIELYHVHTPGLDRPPETKAGATLFRPRWGERRRVSGSARALQSEATDTIRRALQQRRFPDGALRALAWDSGEAIDALLQALARPLESRRFEQFLARVVRLAEAKPDPLEPILLDLRLPDDQARARACAEAASASTLPDLAAYELFFAGRALRDWAAGLLRPGANPSQTDQQREERAALADLSVWQVIRELVAGGTNEAALAQALTEIDLNREHLRGVYERLRTQAPVYLERCLDRGDQTPPRSPQRGVFAPHIFRGLQRSAYDVAAGDAAATLAVTAERAAEQARELPALARQLLEEHTISPAFPTVAVVSHALTAKGDCTPEELLGAAARLREQAEQLYRRAAARDTRFGIAWLRLAQLSHAAGRYRAALDALTGAGGRYPLNLAVRLAGGLVTVEAQDVPWIGPEGLSVEVVEKPDGVALRFVGEQEVGVAVVSGLSGGDVQQVTEHFRRSPNQLRSAGGGSFAEWLLHIQTPALGRHAELARALSGSQSRAALVALAYLGAAPLTPAGTTPPRPVAWLDLPIIAAIE
jgi:hypothetical protein